MSVSPKNKHSKRVLWMIRFFMVSTNCCRLVSRLWNEDFMTTSVALLYIGLSNGDLEPTSFYQDRTCVRATEVQNASSVGTCTHVVAKSAPVWFRTQLCWVVALVEDVWWWGFLGPCCLVSLVELQLLLSLVISLGRLHLVPQLA